MISVSVDEIKSSRTSHLSPRRNSMMYRSMGEEWLAGGSHVRRTPCWVRLAVRHRGGVRSTSGSGVPRGEPAVEQYQNTVGHMDLCVSTGSVKRLGHRYMNSFTETVCLLCEFTMIKSHQTPKPTSLQSKYY